MSKISFKLNGAVRSIDVDSSDVLLEVLRDKMGMKSPKCGCDRGDCGACSVLLDGKTVRSCLIFAIEVDGHEVTTLEGLSRDSLTKIQEAFIELKAFQCGFCTPGIVVAATELLAKNPKPTRDDVKEALGGHLCRCTGYKPIIDAVILASKKE